MTTGCNLPLSLIVNTRLSKYSFRIAKAATSSLPMRREVQEIVCMALSYVFGFGPVIVLSLGCNVTLYVCTYF